MAETILRKVNSKHYKSDSLTVDLDAGSLAEAVVEALQAHLEAAMLSGVQPDSGTQKPPLKPGGMADRAASKGLRPRSRGVAPSRRFVDSLGSRKRRGKHKAKASITVGGYFADWLAKEEGRGARYFEVDGRAEEVIDKAIKEATKDILK